MPTRALIHSFVEAAPHLAWSSRPDGSTEFVNQRFAHYAGLTNPQISEEFWPTLVHAGDVHLLQELRSRNIPAFQPYCIEFRLRRADGVYRWHSAHVTPLRDAQENVVAWYGSALDIDDRHRTTEALRESEARFRAVFESAAIGVARVAFEGARWLEVNDAFCRILGFRREELVGSSWLEITHPDDIDLDWKPFQRMAAGEINTYTVEKRFVHKLGHFVWARLTLSLVRDAQGKPDFEVCLMENITERKLAEEALRRSNEDLERFAYVVSHDLQEPLRQVVSYSQLVMRRYSNEVGEQGGHLLQTIVDGAKRMHDLVGDLLRLAQSVEQLEMERFDSMEGLRSAMEFLAKPLAESRAHVSFDRLPNIVAPRIVLRQIFQNLLSNAVKYGHPERSPKIHVSAERSGNTWIFSVADNGQGIALEQQNRIFGLFARVPGMTASGTGIGLAIVQRLVERLGGRIWVESQIGMGSTFRFTVRIIDDPAEVPKTQQHRACEKADGLLNVTF